MTIKFSTSNKKNFKNIQLITFIIGSDSTNQIITLSQNKDSKTLGGFQDYFIFKNLFMEKIFSYVITINSISYEGLCYYIKNNNKDFFSELSSNFDIFDTSQFNLKFEKKLISLKKKYYIYMLRCKDNSIYTGIATDYQKRFTEHLTRKGAKYTKNNKPIKIERVWKTEGRSTGSKIEYFIKSLTKKQKEDLILNPLLLEKTFKILTLEV